MDLIIYAALCPEGGEHDLAYRLLTLAVRQELGPAAPAGHRPGSGGQALFPQPPGCLFQPQPFPRRGRLRPSQQAGGHRRGEAASRAETSGGGHGGRGVFPPLDRPGGHDQTAGPGHRLAAEAHRSRPAVPVRRGPAGGLYRHCLPIGGRRHRLQKDIKPRAACAHFNCGRYSADRSSVSPERSAFIFTKNNTGGFPLIPSSARPKTAPWSGPADNSPIPARVPY